MICIYHDNCIDGFTAAWAVWKRFPDAEFIPASYGQEPPYEQCEGEHVFIVDFSYPAEKLMSLSQVTRSVVVIDHHKSAKEQLAVLPQLLIDACYTDHAPGLSAQFDMNRSGAGMAWDFFHPDTERPSLVDHVEDRDLWKFELDGTKEVHEYATTFDRTFEAWDELNEAVNWRRSEVIPAGTALLRKFERQIEEIVTSWEKKPHSGMISGYSVPFINESYCFASELGNRLSVGRPFAVVFRVSAEGTHYSLRSQKDGGVDVAEIAQKYGGGGHRNAAGFFLKTGAVLP